MNQKQAVDAISKITGRDIVVSPMYAKINEWREWLEGNVKGFHEYYQKTNLSKNHFTKLKRHKTNMLLRGSEDWASILLNEKTQIELGSVPSEVWLYGAEQTGGIFGQSDFWRNANELVASSRWSGTGAFEVFVRDMVVTEADGRLVSGDGIGINYLSADQIIPVTYDNGIAREVAFISDLTRDGKMFQRVSFHCLEFGLYTILQFTIDDNGKVLPDSQSTIRTGSPIPWFSLIRKSGVNVHDYNSPLGVSIIDGNEDVLRGLDYAFDNFVTDFKLGRKMVLMNRSMFAQDDEGSLVSPQEAGAQLFINAGDKLAMDKDLYQEYNPSLRVDENSRAIQKMLDLFSFKVGLGMGYYQFESGQIQTATEYTGRKQDLIQNASREMIGIEKALTETVRALLWIGSNVLHVAGVDPDTTITIIADDSYIIDQESERKLWRQEIKDGIRSKDEYRVHFFGETEEEARLSLRPTLIEILEGKAAGVVSDVELRRFLFPEESPEEAAKKLAEIRANEPTAEQLLADDYSPRFGGTLIRNNTPQPTTDE